MENSISECSKCIAVGICPPNLAFNGPSCREFSLLVESKLQSAPPNNNESSAIALLDEFIEIYDSCGISLELAKFCDKVHEWKK